MSLSASAIPCGGRNDDDWETGFGVKLNPKFGFRSNVRKQTAALSFVLRQMVNRGTERQTFLSYMPRISATQAMAWRVLWAPGVADEVSNPAEHVQQKLAGQTSGVTLSVASSTETRRGTSARKEASTNEALPECK